MAAVASGSRRVPQGDVVMEVSLPTQLLIVVEELIKQFADGGSYSKSRSLPLVGLMPNTRTD
jgi:hypothetical protein